MGFEQEETLLKKGPGSFLTFVLKVHFRVTVKSPPQAAAQPAKKTVTSRGLDLSIESTRNDFSSLFST